MKKPSILARHFERILQLPEKQQLHELRRLKKKKDRTEHRLSLRRDFREAAEASTSGEVEFDMTQVSRRTSAMLTRLNEHAEHIAGVECHLYLTTRDSRVRAAVRTGIDDMIEDKTRGAEKEDLRALQTLLYFSTFGGGITTDHQEVDMIAYKFALPGRDIVTEQENVEDLRELGFIKDSSTQIASNNLTAYGQATLNRLNERFGPCEEEVELVMDMLPRMFGFGKQAQPGLG